MISFYICFLIVVCLYIYGGYEGTMNLFGFWDLKIRYYIILRKLHKIRNEQAKHLDFEPVSFKQFVKEYEDSKKI